MILRLKFFVIFIYICISILLFFFPYEYGGGFISPLSITTHGDIDFYFLASNTDYLTIILDTTHFWGSGVINSGIHPGPLFPMLLRYTDYAHNPILLNIIFILLGLYFQIIQIDWLFKKGIPSFGIFIAILNPYIILYSFIPSTDMLFALFVFLFFLHVEEFIERGNTNINIIFVFLLLAVLTRPNGILLLPFLALVIYQQLPKEEIYKYLLIISFILIFGIFYYGSYALAFLLQTYNPNSDWRHLLNSDSNIFKVLFNSYSDEIHLVYFLNKFFVLFGFHESLNHSFFHLFYRSLYAFIFLIGFFSIFKFAKKIEIWFSIILFLPTFIGWPSARYIIPAMPLLICYFFYLRRLKYYI